MKCLEIAQRSIAIDSTLSNGTSEVARFYAEVATSLGLCAKIYTERFAGAEHGVVLIARTNEFASAPYAIVTPIETTNPGDFMRWTRAGGNPFAASVDGDVLYGLGALRGKATFAAQIEALSQSPNPDWVLVGIYGAESGQGYLHLHRKKSIRPRAAIVTYPTNMCVALRATGFANFEVSLKFNEQEREARQQIENAIGGTSQSKMFSAPNSRKTDYLENPIVQMMEYLRNLPEGILILSAEGGAAHNATPDSVWLEVDPGASIDGGMNTKLLKLNEILMHAARNLRQHLSEGFTPPHSTFDIGRIQTFADGIRMSGVCRLVPAREPQIYQAWLAKLKQQAAEFGANIDVVEFREPIAAADSAIWPTALVRQAQLSISDQATECTAANLLQRLGLHCAIMGPGKGTLGGLTANENISIRDLIQSVEVYKKIFSEAKI